MDMPWFIHSPGDAYLDYFLFTYKQGYYEHSGSSFCMDLCFISWVSKHLGEEKPVYLVYLILAILIVVK